MRKAAFYRALVFHALIFILLFAACRKPEVSPKPVEGTVPELPLVPFDYTAKHNVNSQVATLGRVLFYDKNLSANKAISCGSCHKQEHAFADNVRFNKGFKGVELKRNSPSIQGIVGFNTFMIGPNGENGGGRPSKENQQPVKLFWDGRQNNVADMVLNPVLNHDEMGMPDFATLVARLYELPYYPALFSSAFGDGTITKERIAFAIEAFIACLNPVSHRFFEGPPLAMRDPDTTSEAGMGEFLFHQK
jgi:cytochrome c peroxidase